MGAAGQGGLRGEVTTARIPPPGPGLDELRQALIAELRAALGAEAAGLQLAFRSRAVLPDGTAVFLLGDGGDRPRGVVHCSMPAAPDMVHRGATRATAVAEALGPALAANVLVPIAEGRVQGLSWALSPFCEPLSDRWPVWPIQRARLREAVFDWVWMAAQHTAVDVEPREAEEAFELPLRHLSAMPAVSPTIRSAAEGALTRLRSGAWVPRRVLTHGDLWKGNILLRRADAAPGARRWCERFALIDWAGAAVRGYAMYDLVRLALSWSLSRRRVALEVRRHCEVLRCGPEDARAHLLAGLGHLALNLEHFPLERFAQMAERCYALLARATS